MVAIVVNYLVSERHRTAPPDVGMRSRSGSGEVIS